MVDKAKQKNSTLTKILVYVNKELSESSSKDRKIPKYQEEIENYAQINDTCKRLKQNPFCYYEI